MVTLMLAQARFRSDASDLHSHSLLLLPPRPQKRYPRLSIVLKDTFLFFDIATGLPHPVQAPLLADFDSTVYKTRLADTPPSHGFYRAFRGRGVFCST